MLLATWCCWLLGSARGYLGARAGPGAAGYLGARAGPGSAGYLGARAGPGAAGYLGARAGPAGYLGARGAWCCWLLGCPCGA